jgi:hypothetical protein
MVQARGPFGSLRRRLASDQRGQVSVIFGLAAVGLTGAVGASLDTAAMSRSGTQLQTRPTPPPPRRPGRRLAHRHRRPDRKAATTFLLSAYDASDSSDAYKAEDSSVSVEVVSRSPTTIKVAATRPVQLPFGFLRGADGATVTRTATAVEADKAPVSLLLLAPDAAQAWRASGNSKVTVDGVAVVNSTSSQALQGNGAAEIISTGTTVAGPTQAASQLDAGAEVQRRPTVGPIRDQA